MIAAAAVGEVGELHEIVAVGGDVVVDEGVAFLVADGFVLAGGELFAVRIEEPEEAVELRVEPPRAAFEEHALALLGGKDIPVHVLGGADAAVDGGVERDAVGVGALVVRLLLGGLGEIADDERARVADAVLADRAHIELADRHARGDGDFEARRLAFFLGQRGGRDARVAEIKLPRFIEISPRDLDLDGGTLFCAERKNALQARPGKLGDERGGQGAEKQHDCNFGK